MCNGHGVFFLLVSGSGASTQGLNYVPKYMVLVHVVCKVEVGNIQQTCVVHVYTIPGNIVDVQICHKEPVANPLKASTILYVDTIGKASIG